MSKKEEEEEEEGRACTLPRSGDRGGGSGGGSGSGLIFAPNSKGKKNGKTKEKDSLFLFLFFLLFRLLFSLYCVLSICRLLGDGKRRKEKSAILLHSTRDESPLDTDTKSSSIQAESSPSEPPLLQCLFISFFFFSFLLSP